MRIDTSRRMTNKYPGACRACRTHVDIGGGVVVGPPWITLCSGCDASGAAKEVTAAFEVPLRVRLSLLGGGERVGVAPLSFLGGPAFDRYRDGLAAAGAVWSRDDGANVAPLDLVPRLLAALERLGAGVELDPDLGATLQARASAVRGEVAEADERLDALAAELRKRGHVLFGYQRTDVRWLTPRTDAILGHEMGLGKTIMALCALAAGAAVLVVCPAAMKGVLLRARTDDLFSVPPESREKRPRAIGGWLGEAAKWRPEFDLGVIDSRRAFRWPRPGEILVANREVLPRAPAAKNPDPDEQAGWDDLMDACPRGVVLVVDEAHYYRNKNQGTRNLRALGRGVARKGGRRWGATGTPLVNGDPDEIWVVLDTLGLAEEAFGNKHRFRSLFLAKGDKKWEASPQVAERLKHVMVRREKAECLKDLPTKRYEHVYVEIDHATRAVCDELLAAITKAGLTLDEYLAGNRLADDTQGDERVPFELISKVRKALANAKIPAMLAAVEALEEANEPTLVFSYHLGPVLTAGARPGWAAIHGEVSAEDRARIVDRFQRGELRGVACTIQAGGVALTLTRAAISNFVDLGWNEATNQQAEDRVHRIGQTRSVLIRRFVADHPLERRVIELNEQKEALNVASVRAATLEADEAAPEHALLTSDQELVDRLARVTARAAEVNVEAAGKEKKRRELAAGVNRTQPRTDRERWARTAIVALDALNQDHATERNGAGYNKLDTLLGASLARQLRRNEGLTDTQWTAAFRMLVKYGRQVGTAPAAEPDEDAVAAAYEAHLAAGDLARAHARAATERERDAENDRDARDEREDDEIPF